MKKTGIARSIERNTMEIILINGKQLEKNLQKVVDNLYTIVKNKELNSEEKKELYEIYAQVIVNIRDICTNNEKLNEEIINIKNYEETEVKND